MIINRIGSAFAKHISGRFCFWSAVVGFICLRPVLSQGQVSLHTAVTLAVMNSPKVKTAQSDLAKANENLRVMKDIFIPSVTTSGGAGYTTGITLTVPTIFTVNAQSLIFSYQQRQYIRAAHSEIEAARAALEEAQEEAEEDTAITYLTLDEAQAAIEALNEQYGLAEQLIHIDEDRRQAGLESDLEVMKVRRGVIQVKLQKFQIDDSLAAAREHLAELTGLSVDSLTTDSRTVPALPPVDSINAREIQSLAAIPGMRAAEENAKAKEQRARGDAEYTWRPIITFGAQYGRVSPINNVSEFYNLHGNYNTANIGFQIELPLLDRVRSSAGREAMMDAARAKLDLDNLRLEQVQNLGKLQRSIPELQAKAELAEVDFEIAQNELTSTMIQLHDATHKPPLTPKDETAAHMDEREKYLDLLDAKLQAAKAEITLLRQAKKLRGWIDSAPAAAEHDTETESHPVVH